jgi:hypothetical protein
MRLRNVNGVFKFKNVSSKIIDWNSKSKSLFQREVKQLLRSFWDLDIVYEEFPVFGTRYSLDFYNATRNIAVEVQGGQHTQYNPFFHNNNRENFRHQLRIDESKRSFCELNNIKLIEIFEEEKDKLSIPFIQRLL